MPDNRVPSVDSCRIRVLTAGRGRRPAGVSTEPPSVWNPYMDSHDLWMTYAGRGQVKTREGMANLYPGVCVWCKPGLSYETTWDPDNPIGNYFVLFDLADRHGRPVTGSDIHIPDALLPRDPALVQSMMRRIVALVLHDNWAQQMLELPGTGPLQEHVGLLLKALLSDLVFAGEALPRGLTSADLATRQRLLNLAAEVRERPQLPPSVAVLAVGQDCCLDHFARQFRQAVGQSPKRFLLETRVRRACDLLTQTHLPLKDIAAQCGYGYVSHFSAQFKRLTGVTPDAYRRQFRPQS